MAVPLLALERFLRSPRTIVAEVLAIAVAASASTIVPQVDDPGRLRRFAHEHPDWGAVVRILALDRILASPLFLGLLLLAGASLAIVVAGQWKRAVRQLQRPLVEGSFRNAPYRRILERPAVGEIVERTELRARGRAGALGSPLFHLGLALIVIAGVTHWLGFSDAIVDLVQGETLDTAALRSANRRHGPLAATPGDLPPVRFDRLLPDRYASGALRGLAARVSVAGRAADLAVNAPLPLGPHELYLASAHGPAAFLEIADGGATDRRIVVLREADDGGYEGRDALPTGLEVLLRAAPAEGEALPQTIEIRVLKRGGLLFLGTLDPGRGVALAGGTRLALADVRSWAMFRVTRDPSWWIAYLGFAVAALGVALMFTVIPVDTAVVVTAAGRGERVFVALRPARYAPLFAERFERLVAHAMRPRGDGER